jgi:hypothetical protein
VLNGALPAAITTNWSAATTSVHPAGIGNSCPFSSDPVLTPVLPAGDELEVPPGQRVERVRHPDATVPIMRIGCS